MRDFEDDKRYVTCVSLDGFRKPQGPPPQEQEKSSTD